MAYPYFYMYKAWIQRQEIFPLFDGYHLPADQTPILYLYGLEKRMHYHVDNHLELLRQQPNCRVLAVENAGHWLFLHQPDICYKAIRSFIE